MSQGYWDIQCSLSSVLILTCLRVTGCSCSPTWWWWWWYKRDTGSRIIMYFIQICNFFSDKIVGQRRIPKLNYYFSTLLVFCWPLAWFSSSRPFFSYERFLNEVAEIIFELCIYIIPLFLCSLVPKGRDCSCF